MIQCLSCKHVEVKGAPQGFGYCSVVERPKGYTISLKSEHSCAKHQPVTPEHLARRMKAKGVV